jgi:hypothetical protein
VAEKKGMEYHIRGRIEPTTRATYIAIAIAVPFVEKEPIRKLESVCPTRSQAIQKLRQLTVELGKAIREEGGEIVSVTTEE